MLKKILCVLAKLMVGLIGGLLFTILGDKVEKTVHAIKEKKGS